MIGFGEGIALHPFGFTGRPGDGPCGEMFDRGHLDHVSPKGTDRPTFEPRRRRLVEIGAGDGSMTDFGAVSDVAFRDPDGWWSEIAIWGDGDRVPLDQATVTTFG